MQIAPTLNFRLDRTTRRRAARKAPAAHSCAATVSAQRAGGPEDQALYRCGCGFAWKANVTTSVDCPNCGSGQAW